MNSFAMGIAATLSALLGAACEGTPPEPSPPAAAGWVRLDGCADRGPSAARVPVVHHVRIPAERAAAEGLELVGRSDGPPSSACARDPHG